MKALIIQGGWEGHSPEAVAQLFAEKLRQNSFEVDVVDRLEVLNDLEVLKEYDLISPCWTMGELSETQSDNLCAAVHSGVGLGGLHGGMGDAFRGDLNYEWMVGGHFVGHPHVGDYTVTLTENKHPSTELLPKEFPYHSEQYYMLVDPAVTVHAETIYKYADKEVRMPVVWTKEWGEGRVFYSALGHELSEFSDYPHVTEMTVKGMIWAARSN